MQAAKEVTAHNRDKPATHSLKKSRLFVKEGHNSDGRRIYTVHFLEQNCLIWCRSAVICCRGEPVIILRLFGGGGGSYREAGYILQRRLVSSECNVF
ncbi:hypothetical protein AVEN_168271-1 [Araneus ventricosus]|uniref:Uncharacterized protein n=1 Tax=Araneus ventricosus TaxID=182803 RepID=A0A4Y2FXF8_ARAVE|nr:hypothetical protein AVEN_168271-1 [Araneus ventricosus]